MSKIGKWIENNRITLIGAIIIILTHFICMAITKSCIFGSNVYLGGDNQIGLLGAVAELKRKIFDHESMYYTWHALGGMNYYFTFVTCLFNAPLMILSAFPAKYFNDACDIMYVVLSVLNYLAINYYLTHREVGTRFTKNSIELLMFTVPYSMTPSFYNMGLNIGYLMAFIVMPFVILGLERVVVNKGSRLYVISLTILVASNVYIGLMGCIFVALYYFTLRFDSIRDFIKKSLYIILISFFSVMVSSFYIIPQLFMSTNGGYGFSQFGGMGFYKSWLEVFDSLTFGYPFVLSGMGNNIEWGCNLYIGIFNLILLIVYFFMDRTVLSIRLRRLTVLIVLLLCTNEEMCNYVMHLFHYSHGIPNRHSMYLLLYMLIISSDAYLIIKERMNKKQKTIALSSGAVLMLLVIFSHCLNNSERWMTHSVSILAVYIYLFLLFDKRRIKSKRYKFVLTGVVLLEVVLNHTYTLCVCNPPEPDMYAKSYTDALERSVDNTDLEDVWRCTYNDSDIASNLGLIYGYSTLLGFSTTYNPEYNESLNNLGIDADSLVIRNKGLSSFLSSIFSVKYLFEPVYSSTNSNATYISKNDSVFGDNTKQSIDGMNIYENAKALVPLVYTKRDFNGYNHLDNEKDRSISDYNNELCYCLSGVKGVFRGVDATFKLEKSNNSNVSIREDMLVIDNNKNDADANEEGKTEVILSFVAPCDGEYSVMVFDNYNVGRHKKGDKVYVYATVANYRFKGKDEVKQGISVTVMDVDKWNEAYSEMENNQVEVVKYNSSVIEGCIDVKEEGTVFTTIPYDSAWRVSVDGECVESECIGKGFLGFNLESGYHDIKLRYVPGGVRLGVAFSIISALVLCIFVVKHK